MAQNTKYISETSKFINGFLEKNPQLVEKRKLLRKTWWDKNIDWEQQEGFNKQELNPEEYPYFTYKTHETENESY